ncbi:MAG: GH92 family glycosyl hydrolase [Muribaculaceae bacterium]|nr:GH92 family glycosyl hydrolase [Muribaculaceae bacterium]
MRAAIILLLTALTVTATAQGRHASAPEVDTRVGTAPSRTLTAGTFGRKTEELGQTLPAVAEPHGMNFWTPQTRDTEHKCVAPYYYEDSLLQGFRNSHWIVGGCTQDYGSMTLMPLSGSLRLLPHERATRLDHATEVATPSLYSVDLPDEGIHAEMTGTSRAAIFNFVYDNAGDGYLVVNPNSDEAQGTISLDPARGEIYGTNPIHRIYQGKGEPAGYAGHFTIRLDRPVTDYGVYTGSTSIPGLRTISHMPESGLWVKFDVAAGDTVTVRAASSFVDIDGARRNLVAEIPASAKFTGVQSRLDSIWADEFGKIRVSGGDTTALGNFYGALYRASLLPRVINDVDGRYPSFAGTGKILTTEPGHDHYDDFSMWDTYRALHPLKVITSPTRTADMMQSLVDKGLQGGWLPIFPCWNSYTAAMIGDHCIATIADAYVKGIAGFDIEAAYTLMRRNAFETPADSADYRDGKGRRALSSYLRYGYIPMEDTVPYAYHKREQTSRTLEYAYDDYALAQVARLLGHTADYDTLMVRSQNYRNVINPATGYASGRHADGSWVTGAEADPFTFQPYITEGAPCHYTWYVPHDIPGLVETLGGREAFTARLDSMFSCGRYWHGNEPCHQVAWLSALVGEPAKTQERVRHVMATEYLNTPGGLAGNDDAGQMSAWYAFAAMGFYPVCPGSSDYVIGSPAFERTEIRLENGKTFTIIAHGASPDNIYVDRMLLNGEPYISPTISHADILVGSTLECFMSSTPANR